MLPTRDLFQRAYTQRLRGRDCSWLRDQRPLGHESIRSHLVWPLKRRTLRCRSERNYQHRLSGHALSSTRYDLPDRDKCSSTLMPVRSHWTQPWTLTSNHTRRS